MHLQSIRLPREFNPSTATFTKGFVLFLLVFSSCSRFSTSHRTLGRPAFVSTVAGVNGEFGEPFGIAVRDGVTYVSDGELDRIWRLDAAGPKTFAEGLDTPSGMAFADGNLIVADTGSHTIRSIDPSGIVSILGGIPGRAGSDDGDAQSATFHGPIGVAVRDGRIYVADTYNDRIRVIDGGKVTTLAGGTRGYRDDAGAAAMFDTPTGLAFFGDKLLVADTGNGCIRVLEPDGLTWTLATAAKEDDPIDGFLPSARLYRPTSIAAAADGSIYFTDGDSVRSIDFVLFLFLRTISSSHSGFRDGVIGGAMFNRPSGLAVDETGILWIADSDNGLVRKAAANYDGERITNDKLTKLRGDPIAFRRQQPARWPYDPPEAPRDVAGTLGELRGQIDGTDRPVHYHNGLDIAGDYGETARFIRDEKILEPIAAENFGTLRELLRMPTLGYIHIRLGRYSSSKPFEDRRFLFETSPDGKLSDVRVPRGARFRAGEPIGTLNPMNHVHLIAGRSGFEMNALDALTFPGIADSRPPIIEKLKLYDENWHEIETAATNSRIKLSGKVRVTVGAFDQVDGNSERRRLGVYRLGYQTFREGSEPAPQPEWTIAFDRLPPAESVPKVYALGSRSGAQGVTVFSYIVTNKVVSGGVAEGFIDTGELQSGVYVLRVYAADYFGNTTTKDISFEVNR
jgi:sugar lactone lactonase YvrE